MNQAKLNTQLYQKMFAEQRLYRAGLLLLPPSEILNHAYEYVCRENILLSLEYNDLSSRQALALLNSPTPLADVFKKLENTGGSIQMDCIWNTVEARANEVIRAKFIESRRDVR